MFTTIVGRDWMQETFDTGNRLIRERAKAYRKRGYRVTVSSLGRQVTEHGLMKCSILTITPVNGIAVEPIPMPKELSLRRNS